MLVCTLAARAADTENSHRSVLAAWRMARDLPGVAGVPGAYVIIVRVLTLRRPTDHSPVVGASLSQGQGRAEPRVPGDRMTDEPQVHVPAEEERLCCSVNYSSCAGLGRGRRESSHYGLTRLELEVPPYC